MKGLKVYKRSSISAPIIRVWAGFLLPLILMACGLKPSATHNNIVLDEKGRVLRVLPDVQTTLGGGTGSVSQPENSLGNTKGEALRAESSLPSTPSNIKKHQFDQDAYMDADDLQKKEFNPEGKRRFYVIDSGGIGGRQVLEMKKGFDMQKFNLPENKVFQVPVSTHYQVVDSVQIKELLGLTCLAKDSDKSIKRWKDGLVAIQKRQQVGDDFLDYDVIDVHRIHAIRLVSYSKSSKQRQFYWPMAVFLDANGCVLEAAVGYAMKQTAETPLEQATIMGNIRVPDKALLLLLTPIEQSPELIGVKLVKQGTLRLTVLQEQPK